MTKEVYLDSGASTQVDPRVVEVMLPYFNEKYGNASSMHTYGRDAKEALNKARRQIASLLGAKEKEIVFTSGGTESNNFCLKSVAFTNREKNHIITSNVEHKCVMNTCKWLETQGFKVTYLEADNEGLIKAETLRNAITDKTLIFSVIHGNNEIGTIQNLEELGKICKEKGVLFHTDACQSFTKTDIDVDKQNLDFVTLNSHKIHGPKGVGALYIREGSPIETWQHGGGHEFGLRSGTEDIPGIVGFAEAAKLATNTAHVEKMTKMRDKLIESAMALGDVKLNGTKGTARLCNNINLSFQMIEGEALGGYLDQKGIATSTGSACSAKTLAPSYVLKAIGLTDEEANGSLRLTLSRFTTEEDIDYVLEHLPKIVKKLRGFSPLKKVTDYVMKKASAVSPQQSGPDG